MEKIQYKTIEIKHRTLDEADLNELGREGWELVSLINATSKGTTNQIQYIFKRKLSE